MVHWNVPSEVNSMCKGPEISGEGKAWSICDSLDDGSIDTHFLSSSI